MSTKNRIEKGDRARVFFSHSTAVEGVIDYVPCIAGDNWIILECQANLPVYIQQYDYMILVEKGDNNGST